MPDVRLLRRTASSTWHPFQGGDDITPFPPPSAAGTSPSGVWGAGFQNAGAIHPTNQNLWLIAADVAGVHLSADAGMSWTPNNTGLDTSQKLHGVAIRWSETNPNLAYYYSCAAQEGSAQNYLFSGVYDPSLGVIVRWNIIETVPGGWASGDNGAQTGDSLASAVSGHPRQSKRRMLGLDEAQGLGYICSADGLWRVNLDGTGTPVRVWGAGNSLTSVSLDPNDKTVAYVTVDLGSLTGIHKLSGIRGTPTVTSFRPSYAQYAQSLKAIIWNNVLRLFVVTGKSSSASDAANSVLYWPGTGSFTAGWQDITGNLNADETGGPSRWAGIDAAILLGGSARILVANSYDATGGSNGAKVGWVDWSGTGTPTWTKPSGSNTDYRVGDTTGATWWLASRFGGSMFDKPGYDCVDPALAPSNPDLMMTPGRSGIWRRDRSSGAVSNLWHPAVKGTAVTTSLDVLVSNQNPLNVAFGDTDWTVLRSTDGMVTQPMAPNAPASECGYILAQAEVSGKVLLAQGARSANNAGHLHRCDDPWSGASPTWVDELSTGSGGPWSTTANTPQVRGCALGVNASSTQVILAALRGGSGQAASQSGFWRKVGAGGSGAWSHLTLPGYPVANEFTTTSNNCNWRFAWQSGGGAVVWLSDPVSGLWQSRDYGATWTRFYATSWTVREGGELIADPTRAGVYYATQNPGPGWKITGGNGATPSKVVLNPSAKQGAGLAVHPVSGNLYMAETGVARLWKSTDGGGTWADITTASWEAMCTTIKAMTIGSNGMLYVAMYAGFAITDVE